MKKIERKARVKFECELTLYGKDDEGENYGVPTKRKLKKAIKDDLDNLFGSDSAVCGLNFWTSDVSREKIIVEVE